MPAPRESVDSFGSPLVGRLKRAMLKPVPESDGPPKPVEVLSPEQLEARARHADDKERLIGLFGAPLAALIALLVGHTLVVDDPPALLADGLPNKLHVNPSTYYDLVVVLVALAFAMLVAATLRKRLFIGMAMALYGLAIFNLHYWGFGIPFLIAGSWYLVRAYRFQRAYRDASGEGRARYSGSGARAVPPRASKRYTPPSPGRVSRRRAAGGERAG